MQAVSGTLGRFDIAPSARKGRWLMPTSEAAVAEETIERNGCAEQSVATLPAQRAETVDETAEDTDDYNARLMALSSARSSASIRVTKA